MKRISPTPALFVVALALSACSTQPSNVVELYGQPAPPSAAERTIVITPATRYVNIEGGQIVRFVVGDKEFGWNFNTASAISSFELNDVAPPGLLNQSIRAYVSPDPKYRGGDGREIGS